MLVAAWTAGLARIIASSSEAGDQFVAVNRDAESPIDQESHDNCLLAAETASRRFGVVCSDNERGTSLLQVPAIVADRLAERVGAEAVFHPIGPVTATDAAAVFIGMWDPNSTGDGITAAGQAWATAQHLS